MRILYNNKYFPYESSCPSVGWLVHRFVGRSVRQESYRPAPIGALVTIQVIVRPCEATH